MLQPLSCFSCVVNMVLLFVCIVKLIFIKYVCVCPSGAEFVAERL